MLSKAPSQAVYMLLFVVLLAASACSVIAPTAPTVTPVPTIDPNAIAADVLQQIEPRLAQLTSTPAPTVDANEITAAVLAEVASQLDQATITPAPTPDMKEITEEVLSVAGSQLEDSLISLYQRANPSVVFIIVPFIGSGSGFVYGADGHIVTNSHVLGDADNVEVVFANGARKSADRIGADVDADLAVIKVDGLPEGVEPLPLAEPDSIQVGQFVVAIGNPFGEQGSMSLGIVSGLDRSLRSQREGGIGSQYSLPAVIQTDAPINPGNSGGPLLNLKGEVVGVNAAIRTLTGTNSGVGFSIPVAAVRQIVPSLISDGAYVYPYLGVGFEGDISLAEQDAFDLPQTAGAYVISVTESSPAEEAGLIAADPITGRGGDLIVKLDDQEILSFSDLNSFLVFRTKVGQTVDVSVIRDGALVVLPLTLGARPSQ